MQQNASGKPDISSADQIFLIFYGTRKCITVFTDPLPEPAESSPLSHTLYFFILTSIPNLMSFLPFLTLKKVKLSL
jgi:hypothetical protein